MSSLVCGVIDVHLELSVLYAAVAAVATAEAVSETHLNYDRGNDIRIAADPMHAFVFFVPVMSLRKFSLYALNWGQLRSLASECSIWEYGTELTHR